VPAAAERPPACFFPPLIPAYSSGVSCRAVPSWAAAHYREKNEGRRSPGTNGYFAEDHHGTLKEVAAMFSWSRGEMWLAVVVSALIVAGALGHLWLTHARLQGASVVVYASEGPAQGPAADERAEARPDEEAGGAPEGLAKQRLAAPGGAGGTTEAGGAAAAPGVAGGTVSGAVDTRININTATVAELQRLPGIGPALAARIVAYREAWGPFRRIEDLLEVPGIGQRRFEQIKDLIKVE